MADTILFRVQMDAHFYAKDIDEACRLLADHFANPPEPGTPGVLVAPSDLDIRPAEVAPKRAE